MSKTTDGSGAEMGEDGVRVTVESRYLPQESIQVANAMYSRIPSLSKTTPARRASYLTAIGSSLMVRAKLRKFMVRVLSVSSHASSPGKDSVIPVAPY